MSEDEQDYLGVERWAFIPFLDAYQVSTHGRIKGRAGKVLKLQPTHNGYLKMRLWCPDTNTKPTIRVHRIVAEAFLPNPHNLPEVHHMDWDRMNNSIDNLEWCTRDYNLANRRKSK